MVNPRFVIKAVLSGQRLNINIPLTVAGTVNYIGVEAKCTSEWDDCTVVCYLYQSGTGYIAQLGLVYDSERKLYYFPNAERLTLTAGQWAVWFVGVMASSGQETYKITSETRYFTVHEYPFASSIPPGDISLDEEAIARATDAQNKANLLLDKYNAGDLTGPKGDPGDPAEIGFVQASVDNTTNNPRCVVTVTENPENTYNMQFAFSGIKGEKGDTGDTGPKGDTGAQGTPGRDGTDGRDGQTIDDYVVVQAEQPTSETNKMWLKPTAGAPPVMIPTVEEFEEIGTDVTNLKSAVDQMLLPGNLFDIESCEIGKRLETDGTTTNSSLYVFSDYIKVNAGETLYKSGTIYRAAKYSANKTWIANITITDGYVVPNDAVYIRICAISENAPNVIVTRNPLKVNKVGAYPSINISGLNIDDEASAFISKNNTHNRNKIIPSSVSWVSCGGFISKKFTADEASSIYAFNVATGNIDLRITTDSYSMDGVTACSLLVYIPDSSKTNTITIRVGDGSTTFSDLRAGWNKLTYYTYSVTLPSTNAYTSVRITGTGSAGNEIYITRIELHSADKANLILIQDGGYVGFYNDAYATLKTTGVPVTWALDPGRIGTDNTVLTQEQILALAKDGNSEFSFHGWNPSEQATATMTATEIQDEASKCLYYLRSNGICPNHVWRAAHTQNSAPNASAEIGMVEALATGTGNAALNVFPFINIWNVPRVALHSLNQGAIDSYFDTLKKTHSTLVCYTHNIGTGTYDMSAENFAYFVNKIVTGINEGWLRPTTYSRLMDTQSAWLDLS